VSRASAIFILRDHPPAAATRTLRSQGTLDCPSKKRRPGRFISRRSLSPALQAVGHHPASAASREGSSMGGARARSGNRHGGTRSARKMPDEGRGGDGGAGGAITPTATRPRSPIRLGNIFGAGESLQGKRSVRCAPTGCLIHPRRKPFAARLFHGRLHTKFLKLGGRSSGMVGQSGRPFLGVASNNLGFSSRGGTRVSAPKHFWRTVPARLTGHSRWRQNRTPLAGGQVFGADG